MSTHNARVFVVDDENVIAFTLAAILNRSGFEALAFTHPQEALRQAKVNPPDLVISDVMMPEMTGVDLAVQIKACSPNTHILLFSGQATTNDLLQSARNRGHNFRILTKPIHPTELLAAVNLLTAPLAAVSVGRD